MIDTHAHLDGCADAPEVLLARAREAGVDRVVTIGSGIESCRAALAVAEREPGVFAALGVHPHQAGGEQAERLDELRALLGHERAVAVGETGLDFYRDYAPRDRQLELFRGQLQVAGEASKAVVIHSRSAERETLDELERFAGVVVLHCFSSPGLLEGALARRYYVSFAGNVTYPRADDLLAAAVRVSRDRLLVETDSPYLAPQPRRGRPNEPAHVAYTLRALAAARSEPLDQLERQIDENAGRAFSLP